MFAWRWENDSSKVDWKTTHTLHSNETRSIRRNIRKQDLQAICTPASADFLLHIILLLHASRRRKTKFLHLFHPHLHITLDFTHCWTKLFTLKHTREKKKLKIHFTVKFNCMKMVWQGLFHTKVDIAFNVRTLRTAIQYFSNTFWKISYYFSHFKWFFVYLFTSEWLQGMRKTLMAVKERNALWVDHCVQNYTSTSTSTLLQDWQNWFGEKHSFDWNKLEWNID